MGLNNTPKGERVQIALFGKRNAGKSSLINAITSQNLAIVSEVKGTTTDPVYKAMELLPIGPVMIVDTPGLDDSGTLGEQRIEKTIEVLNKTDIAILAADITQGFSEFEMELMEQIKVKQIPCVVVLNKIDLFQKKSNLPKEEFRDEVGKIRKELERQLSVQVVAVSVNDKHTIEELKTLLPELLQKEEEKPIVGDLIERNDMVVLVVPIDKAAPKGRLILPQQQTIRDILDNGAIAVVTKEGELEETLNNLGKTPKLVITDSQVFGKVAALTPEHIKLTSFSILFARYKGDLESLVRGVRVIDTLKDGDTVLISEGCTHHRQCDDIGTVKLPKWIAEYTKKDVNFEFSSGAGFPKELSKYAMIVHCGGCTLNKREMAYRIDCAKEQGIPITNYGMLIALLQNTLSRSLEIFPDIHKIIK